MIRFHYWYMIILIMETSNQIEIIQKLKEINLSLDLWYLLEKGGVLSGPVLRWKFERVGLTVDRDAMVKKIKNYPEKI